MTRRGSVAMSVGREAAPRKGKGGDNARWANTKLTVSKIKKIHVVDSVATNGW
jgi:hypothetical protein